jgi:hypothetical protein
VERDKGERSPRSLCRSELKPLRRIERESKRPVNQHDQLLCLQAPLVEGDEGERSQSSLEGLFPSDPAMAYGTKIPGDGKTRATRKKTTPIPSNVPNRQRNP